MKNKTIKRLLAAVLSCSMLAAALAGCGNSDDGTSKSSESQTSSVATSEASVADKETEASTEEAFDPRSITEGVKLTVAVPSDPKISDYNDNEVTYMVEEALGVDLEFIVFPSEDYKSKLNLMINSGEKLPDIIFSSTGYDTSWITEGAILDLTEYYNNPDYCPNIRFASEKSGVDIQTYMSNADGKIFGLPRWEQARNTQTFKRMWIYKPWLDALNLEVPETIDEFYEACKAIVENDMNGNGKRDEIGMWGAGLTGVYNGWFGTLMSAYVYAHDDNFRVVENGEVYMAYATEEWKEGLKFIKKFFDEGLIPTEIFTQNQENYEIQMFSETPTVFSFCQYNTRGTDAKRESEYTYVTGLKNSVGENGYSYWVLSKPSVGGMISADCENPEAAFIVGDYMCSEYISLCNRYGKQGVNWDYWENVKDEEWTKDYGMVNGGEPYIVTYLNVIRDPENEKDIWTDSTPHNVNWRQNGVFIRTAYTLDLRPSMINATTEEQKLGIYNDKKTQEAIDAYFANKKEEIYDYGPTTIEESSAIGETVNTLNSYVREMIAAFLTGGQDIDAYWDTYLAELDKIGIDDVVAVYQTAYDRVH